MALIKKAKLASVYGIEEQIPLEPVLIEPIKPSNGNGHKLDIDESLIQNHTNQLIEAKEQEIALQKEQALAQINQELEQAKQEAAAIITQAQTDAEEQQMQIQAQYAELENQKQEQAAIIAQEREKAFDEAMGKADAYIAELMQILGTFNDFKAEILSEAKQEIISLALAVVRQILDSEAKTDPKLLEEQVKNAITRVSVSSGLLQIYLNPADMEKTNYLESVLGKVLDKNVKVHFEAGQEVDPGSCIVKTQGGRLDASFSSQLELIKVAFERYLGHKINELPVEDATMDLDPKKLAKALAQTTDEPSDADLAMVEELDETELEIEDDMDSLLQDILASDADVKEDSSVKIDDDIPLAKAEAEAKEEDEEELDEEDMEFEQFDEFAEDTDVGDDSNFDGTATDERFPDY